MPLPASDNVGITTNGGGAAGSVSETDNVTALELQSNKRMLYFSDGVMEELSSGSEDDAEADVTDKCYAVQLDEVRHPLIHLPMYQNPPPPMTHIKPSISRLSI